jgi:hypothetical protein
MGKNKIDTNEPLIPELILFLIGYRRLWTSTTAQLINGFGGSKSKRSEREAKSRPSHLLSTNELK